MAKRTKKAPGRRPRRSEPEMDMETFQALPDAEKENIYREIDRQAPERMRSASRPLTPAERRRLARFRQGLGGRPKVKEGAKAISVTVEQGLLRRADKFASSHGISRAQLVARGLELAIGA